MDYHDIAYDQVGAVARIWHNRTQVRNAEGARMPSRYGRRRQKSKQGA